MSKGIKRRDFLTGLSVLMGGALTYTAIKAFDGAEDFSPGDELQLLSQDQAQVLEQIADIIIPETDTPGAAGVGIKSFFDHMLVKWMAKKDQKKFMATLTGFMKSEPNFLSQDLAQQTATVQKLDDEMTQDKPFSAFYRTVKELTLVGYYTSEVGATIELAYDPVPGPYHQVSIDDYSRVWAT